MVGKAKRLEVYQAGMETAMSVKSFKQELLESVIQGLTEGGTQKMRQNLFGHYLKRYMIADIMRHEET